MDKLKKGVEDFKEEVRTDGTLNRVKGWATEYPPKVLPASKEYLIAKVPVVQWLPRYSPSWLVQDFVAGLTIGVMLIPQGLAYAQIATIPIENGLYASWLPPAIAVIMGTSKGTCLHHKPLLDPKKTSISLKLISYKFLVYKLVK